MSSSAAAAAAASNSAAKEGVEERTALMNTQQQAMMPVQKSRWRRFVHFLWDPSTKQLLGRTGLSWLELGVFYVIFYSCLILFWAICLYIFLLTLNKETPHYYGKGTIVGINPGMGFQPWIRKDPDSTLIQFDPNNPKSYEVYKTAMDKFLERYVESNETRRCDAEETNKQEGKKPCRFDTQENIFDVADFDNCSPENDYGFKLGTPCVILTLNRLMGWVPVSYEKDSIPEEAGISRGDYTGDVLVSCQGEYFSDVELLGPVEYAPKSGLLKKYFPYRFNKAYQQPIAMARFTGLRPGVLVMVECNAYAANIVRDRSNRLGMTHFELLMDKVPQSAPS